MNHDLDWDGSLPSSSSSRKSAASRARTAPSAVLDPPAAAPGNTTPSTPASPARKIRQQPSANSKRFASFHSEEEPANRQAELFYLQKQIQLQTQMVFILENGERVQGIIEWYDRQCIKVRGKSRVLIYKSSIKYLYKAGEIGTAPVK